MKANVYQVCILTVFIAAAVHLDGSGASTFLIVIPALLPIYERLSIRKTSMLLIITSAMGVMNVIPWGGPTLRAATNIRNGCKFALAPYYTYSDCRFSIIPSFGNLDC